MNSRWAAVVVVIVAIVAGAGGYFVGRGNKGGAEARQEKEEAAVVPVKVMPLERKRIAETIRGYGTLAALPEKVVVYSSQFDGVVEKLYVVTGQSVKSGDALADVAPAPEMVLALKQAAEATGAAERDLKLVRQRYDSRLATAQELSQGQSTLAAAKLKQQDLEQRGVGKRATIQAKQAGVVSKVDLEQGQAAASGAGIVEVLPEGQAVARAGIEPARMGRVRVGQKAKVKALSAGQEPIEGKVKMVGQKVNPETRLVDVLIELPEGAGLVLDTPVSVAIEIASKEALVVPRDAALAGEEGKFEVFTVKDNKAVKHEVTVGIETEDEVEIVGEDLKEGDAVVVEGNSELEDKTEVKVEGAGGESSTQPTSAPATQQTKRGAGSHLDDALANRGAM